MRNDLFDNYDMEQQQIDRWMQQHQNDTDAQLLTTIDQKIPQCVDYVAARELLDRREKTRRSEEHQAAERRHRESVAVDRSARNIGWAALVVATLALLVAVVALPQVQSRISTQPTAVLPTDSTALRPVVTLPASPPAPMDDSARSPIQPNPTKPSEPPSPDHKPKALPPSPSE